MKCPTCGKITTWLTGIYGGDDTCYCRSCFNSGKADQQIVENLSLFDSLDARVQIVHVLRMNRFPEAEARLRALYQSLSKTQLQELNNAANRQFFTAHEVNRSAVEAFAHKVLNSNEFITAFESSLPKGEKDEEFGIDYIPFILRNIEIRRKRFTKSANLFLTVTLGLGILLTLILIFFGYVLLNDSAIGDTRRLKILVDEVQSLNENLSLRDYYLRPVAVANGGAYTDNVIQPLRLLRSNARSEDDSGVPIETPVSKQLDNTIFNIESTNDYDRLSSDLDSMISDPSFKDVREELIKIRAKKLEIDADKARNLTKLELLPVQIETIIPELRSELTGDQFKTSELIKRISIGLVIGTFFLSVLRYFAKLYSEHQRQVVKAENDELAVRKFYVVYKSLIIQNASVEDTLNTFINPTFSSVSSNEPTDIDPNKFVDMIKDWTELVTKYTNRDSKG